MVNDNELGKRDNGPRKGAIMDEELAIERDGYLTVEKSLEWVDILGVLWAKARGN